MLLDTTILIVALVGAVAGLTIAILAGKRSLQFVIDIRLRAALADYLEYRKRYERREQYDSILFREFEREKCIDRLIMGRAKADLKLLNQRQQFTGEELTHKIAEREREIQRRSDKLMKDPVYRTAMERKLKVMQKVRVMPTHDDEPDKT